jgi:hypothetical protein
MLCRILKVSGVLANPAVAIFRVNDFKEAQSGSPCIDLALVLCWK